MPRRVRLRIAGCAVAGLLLLVLGVVVAHGAIGTVARSAGAVLIFIAFGYEAIERRQQAHRDEL
ncbi:MAG: hypothetical protein ACR2KJ_12080 [Jatrophihabitans sp.]